MPWPVAWHGNILLIYDKNDSELINEITKTKALKLVTDTQLKTISPETINSSIKRIKKKVLVALGEEPDLDLVTLWCKNTNTIIAPRKEK